MDHIGLTRRGFLQSSAALAGALALAPAGVRAAAEGKRTAIDQVPLGRTGLKISRLGIGTGSQNGHVQKSLGKEDFVKVIRYANERGITYIDNARNYVTFDWIADAIRDIPRERVFLLTKVWGVPENPLKTIDEFRSAYKTDYVDALLVHCMTKPGWTGSHRKLMDAIDEAKQRQWVRSKGVSCHSLVALQESTQDPFNEVHLVRVNPQGKHMDKPNGDSRRDATDIEPVLAEIKSMHEQGRGVIGMKICANGDFANQPAEREKSIRFAVTNPNIDSIVIGMRSYQEIDENIEMVNKALAPA